MTALSLGPVAVLQCLRQTGAGTAPRAWVAPLEAAGLVYMTGERATVDGRPVPVYGVTLWGATAPGPDTPEAVELVEAWRAGRLEPAGPEAWRER